MPGIDARNVTCSFPKWPRLRPALLLCWLCALASVGRGQVPDVYLGKRIVETFVAGESAALIDPDDLRLPRGASATRAVLRSLTTRLLATGDWVDVQVDVLPGEGGVRLRLMLRPKIVVARVEVSGQDELDEAAVLDAVRISDGSAATDEDLQAVASRVRAAYAERGFFETTVSASFRATAEPARKVLMVDIVEGVATRLHTIQFTGYGPPYAPKLISAMGTDVGDVYDKQVLDAAVTKGARYLRAQGYLEARLAEPEVVLRGQQADVRIEARVGPRYDLRIWGMAPLTHADVVAALDFEHAPLSRSHQHGALVDGVVDLYARSGMPNAKVEIRRLRGRRSGRAVLEVHVKPGTALTIVNIEFPGAHLLGQQRLRDQVYSYLEEDLPGTGIVLPVDAEVVDALAHGERRQKRTVPKPMRKDPRTTYYESTYADAIEHIENLGRAEGLLSIKAGPVRIRRLSDAQGALGANRAVVEIPVVEGPRTRLHAVELRGAEVMTPREVLVIAGLKRNEPLSYVALEEARRRVLDAYKERGYFFARVEPQVRISEDRTRALVLLEVVERFPVHVGRIVVRGAERTRESYIRDVIKLGEGDHYSPSKAQRSEEALQALGVFSGVQVSLQDPELAARVKTLIVQVSERPNQYLDFSSGVSTGQGLRGGFEYGYRNLFGQAIGLALRVQLSYQLFFVDKELERRFKDLTALNQRIERRVSLGISIPRTPFLDDVKTSVDLVHLRQNERDFGIESSGVGVTMTYRPFRRITTVFGADVENNRVDLFVDEVLEEFLKDVTDPRLQRLLRVPEGETTLVGLRATVSYDRRDSPFTPTRGLFLSLDGELARALRTDEADAAVGGAPYRSEFLKLALTANGYVPITKGVVFAGQLRLGRIFHLRSDSETYPNRAFFLGGVDTIRGYFEDALVPQDKADEIVRDPLLSAAGVVRNGDIFVLLRGEVRFPLYGELHGGVFADMGNLWVDPGQVNLLDLRPSVGVGLRMATPVGPIALDYGVLIRRRRALQEPFGALHFSIGLF